METNSIANDQTSNYLDRAGGGFTAISQAPASGRLVWGVWRGDEDHRMQQCILDDGGKWVRVVGLFRDGKHDVESVAAPMFWR
jgi:hypothetical protein